MNQAESIPSLITPVGDLNKKSSPRQIQTIKLKCAQKKGSSLIGVLHRC